MTNVPNQETVRVRLVGQGTAQPVVPKPLIAVDTSPVNFGEVALGRDVSKPLLVSNFSEATLLIGSITSSNEQISIIPSQLRIPGKESRSFTVRYRPRSVGKISVQVTVSSNDPGSPAVVVPVTTSGIQSEGDFAVTLSTNEKEDNGSFVVSDDGQISIQVYGQNVRDAVGYLAAFRYDSQVVEFQGSDIGEGIPDGRTPGEQFSSGTVEVMAASFGQTIRQEDAHLGTIRFQAKPAFEAGQITLQHVRLRREGRFEVHSDPIVLNFGKAKSLSTDFNGDGAVDFIDFLGFAVHFGVSSNQVVAGAPKAAKLKIARLMSSISPKKRLLPITDSAQSGMRAILTAL